MEQESWKMDKEETGLQLPEGPLLCSNKCGFFGSAATMNLCSQCYRDMVMEQAKAAEAAAAMLPKLCPELQQDVATLATCGALNQSVDMEGALAASSSKQAKPRLMLSNHCFTCKKRIGLTGFKCKCGNRFCALHRYHDKHNCSFNYHAAARDAIARANPVIKADKLDKI